MSFYSVEGVITQHFLCVLCVNRHIPYVEKAIVPQPTQRDKLPGMTRCVCALQYCRRKILLSVHPKGRMHNQSTPYSSNDLQERVTAWIGTGQITERVVHVLSGLPAHVNVDLLDDPCFHIELDSYVPGRGSQVRMMVPLTLNWQGSRSVVLKHRLADCAVDFAHYVIAHEFAHAHLWNGGWGEITDREEAADALAASWGFPRPLHAS